MKTTNEYLIGLAGLGRLLESGVDFPVLGPRLEAQLADSPADLNAMLDLSTLLFLTGNAGNLPFALDYQRRALQQRQVYCLPPPENPTLRLLVLMAPGDMTSNTPVDCLLERSDVAVTFLYVLPGRNLPTPLPEHDAVFVAIGESSANQILLQQLADITRKTARPVVNAPQRIARLVRNQAAELLKDIAGTVIPVTVHTARSELLDVAERRRAIRDVLPDVRFPIIARPIDSQGGKDLDKLDGIDDLAAYLARVPSEAFFVSNFVDYRSADGQFKKLRIVLVGGRPFAGHMGISSHWMIHYINAQMHESADKRREEEEFFAAFDQGFAVRHRESLAAIGERIGLDYLTIDCAELPDGTLLIFEVDNAGVVHALDDPKLFPYKQPAMHKIFDAFRGLLLARSRRGANSVRVD